MDYPAIGTRELLYIYIIRYHHYSGNRLLQSSFQEFYEKSENINTVLYPYMIAPCLERLNMEKERYVQNHSVLPFYRLFLKKDNFENICYKMFYENKPYTNYLRSQHKQNAKVKSDRIYYCPKCLDEHNGYAGIQTFHQIPGVHVCPKHFCYLNSIAVESYRKLLYWEKWDRTVVECEPDSVLVQMAKDVSYIMEHTPDMDNAVFREYLFDEALHSGIFRLGRWDEEEDAKWKTFYKKLPKEYEVYRLGLSFQRFSSQKLIGGINPIEYLLFIRCHFGSFEAFINQLS